MYFNIPNLMGYFRILMIPVFLFLYANADTGGELFAAFFVLGLSYLSDLLDGMIARKFNMVTDWGKMLDPIADKLTQIALAVAVTVHYPLIVDLLVFFVLKELYMGLAGLFLIKKGKPINGATWYGKVCTVVVDIGVFILLICPDLSYEVANLIILIMLITMALTWIRYIVFHIGIYRNKDKKWGGKCLLIAYCLFPVYVLVGATVPYIKQPMVSDSYKNSFDVNSFYGDGSSGERVLVIGDNGLALSERIRMIESAKERILISTFDFRSDNSGKQMIAALLQAADRGVEVKLLMDGFNSLTHMEGNPYFYALSSHENILVKIYNTANPFLPWKGMSRMHDKYMIVDEKAYILGGRNLFDYFLGDHGGYQNHDWDVLVSCDETCGSDTSLNSLADYFNGIWKMELCKPWRNGEIWKKLPSVSNAKEELYEIYDKMSEEHPKWFDISYQWEDGMSAQKITLLSNPTGLYSKEPWVFYGLTELMKQAENEVIIHTPYIICNDMMYQTFSEICSLNTDITLMTNASYNNGNQFGAVDYVMNKDKILKTGLNVLEYAGGTSYHGKCISIDNDISIVGSFNMDMKSVYQDTEVMLVIHGKEVNELLKEWQMTYQQYANQAVLDPDEKDSLFNKDVKLKKRILRRIIQIADPYFRFLM